MAEANDRENRNRLIIELHLAGATATEIGKRVELTPAAVRKITRDGLAARVDAAAGLPPEQLTELARLDRMTSAIWAEARGGNLDAIDRVMKLAERREKIGRPKVNSKRMRTAVDTTIGASADINKRLDAAVIEGAQLFADQLDEVLANGTSIEVTKALYLMPHLKNYLEAMLATPAARRAAGIAAQDAGQGRLAHLRSITGAAQGGPASTG